MHIVHNNMQSNYNMFNQQLQTTDQQQDPGIINNNFKTLRSINKQRKAAKWQTEYWGSLPTIQVQKQRTILPLFKSLVRPHLEHLVQFWSPNLRRDIEKIEKTQRKASKMIHKIRNHSYHQRIQDLNLICLVEIRLQGQLIEVFKYLNKFTAASARGLCDYDLNNRTRNNRAKLIIKYFNTSVGQHF